MFYIILKNIQILDGFFKCFIGYFDMYVIVI